MSKYKKCRERERVGETDRQRARTERQLYRGKGTHARTHTHIEGGGVGETDRQTEGGDRLFVYTFLSPTLLFLF